MLAVSICEFALALWKAKTDVCRASLAMNVLARCPKTKLVLSGYRYVLLSLSPSVLYTFDGC